MLHDVFSAHYQFVWILFNGGLGLSILCPHGGRCGGVNSTLQTAGEHAATVQSLTYANADHTAGGWRGFLSQGVQPMSRALMLSHTRSQCHAVKLLNYDYNDVGNV